jgi:hypothetical protein
MRHAPFDVRSTLMSRLHRLTGDVEVAHVKIRLVDLYPSTSCRLAGIVLVGDALVSSCVERCATTTSQAGVGAVRRARERTANRAAPRLFNRKP